MAHVLHMEQQNEEIAEGMFEWKVEGFLQNIRGIRKSPAFKFGRSTCSLKLDYKFSEHFLGYGVRQLTNFEIEMHTAESFKINIFSKATYFKVGLIGRNERVYLSTKVYRFRGNDIFVISCHIPYLYAVKEYLPIYLPKGILTSRLVWSNNEDRLEYMLRRRTSSDQIEEAVPKKSLEKLSKDFETFFENRTNTDCVLVVGNEQFPVHRDVLSARSPVFAAMFHHDTTETSSGVVNIPDVDPGIMNDVLHYIYSGQILTLDTVTAAPLYVVATNYGLTDMKDECLNFVMENLTMEYFVDAIDLAHVYKVPSLEEKVIKFIAENAEQLQENDAWKVFSKTKSSVGMKYLQSALNSSIKNNTKE